MTEGAHVHRQRRSLRVLTIVTVSGVVLMALPDPDNRLFSLSNGHGPGLLDAVGAGLLVVACATLNVFTWRSRSALALTRAQWSAVGVVSLTAIVVLAWSIATDTGWWWLLAAFVLALVQGALATRAGLLDGLRETWPARGRHRCGRAPCE